MRHVGSHVTRRRRAGREAGTRQAQRSLDPVQAEGSPVVAVGVPGQQIPAVRGVDQPVRLDVAGGDAAAAFVAQPQLPLVPAGGRDRGQQFGVHGAGRGSGERERGGMEGGDLVPEPGRQHRLELGQRPERGLLQPGHAAGRRGMQADRHRHRLLIVQQQRRQGSAAGAEPVTARRARYRVHRIPQVAQPVDVTPHGPQPDAEPPASSAPRQSRRDCRRDSRRSRRAEVSSMRSMMPFIGARS